MNNLPKTDKSISLLSGWVKTAQDEYKAYVAIQKVHPDYRVLFRQKYNILCQSLELALKSFLISKGFSIKDIKTIGHDLVALCDTSRQKYGLLISPSIYNMVKILNSPYKSRKLLYFEYQYKLPADINPLASFVHLMISKITYSSKNSPI